VEIPSITLDGTLAVSALIKNIGEKEGTDIFQLYIRDEVASVTWLVKELKRFLRVTHQPE
jgi:beta-glucosidase